MNTRAAGFTALACALLGGWLPSLWLAPEPAARSLDLRAPPVSGPPPAAAAVPSSIPSRTPMGMLRDAVAGKGYGFAEAEELASALAGETAGRNVKDAASFLKMLEEKDSNFQTAALQAWAEANPDHALTTLMTSGRTFWPGYETIRRLAAQNPDKALALLRAAPPGSAREFLWGAVLTGCADKDPALALQVIQSRPAGTPMGELWKVVHELARRDPPGALAWARSLPAELRIGFVNEELVFGEWAKNDSASAMKEWEQSNGKKEPPLDILDAWEEKDPEGLFQWALSKGDGAESALNHAITGMVWRDPDKALQMLSRVPAGVRAAALPVVGEVLAERNPQAALTWMRSLPEDERSAVLSKMLPHLSGLPVEERKNIAREAGVNTPAGFNLLFDADRAEAQKALAELPPVEALTICRVMSARLAEPSPASAAPFVSTLAQALSDPASASGLAEAMKQSVASPRLAGGTNDTFSAASSSLIGGPDSGSDSFGEAGGAVLESIATFTTVWATQDPPAAAAWVATLPAGNARTAAAVNLAINWGHYDLPAARVWVEQLPAGETRDQAAAQITQIAEATGAASEKP